MLCDNLALPFRDSSIDAVLSIAVIHHIATAERRVHALRELSRILKVGGRVMISVWAFEQRQRKFESQDVLIPWHKPPSRVGSVAGKGKRAWRPPYEHLNNGAVRLRLNIGVLFQPHLEQHLLHS